MIKVDITKNKVGITKIKVDILKNEKKNWPQYASLLFNDMEIFKKCYV